MVTCNVSHKMGSFGEEGVGGTVVAVGGGMGVTRVGMGRASSAEEQVLRMSSPIGRILRNFLIENI
jgi:hypothetical protein